MNQCEKVMDHLRQVGSISGMEAADLYRIRDSLRQISEIRMGPQYLKFREVIAGITKTDKLGQRYKRYYLRALY